MLLAGISALWGIGLPQMAQVFLLLGWCLAYLVLMASVDRRWRNHQSVGKGAANA